MENCEEEEEVEEWDQIWTEDADHQSKTDVALSSHVSVGGGEESKVNLTRMALNDNKAGMENLDKQRINKLIYEMSKGSKYYENEQRKEEQVQIKIDAQQRRVQSLDACEIARAEQQADVLLAEIEEMRDFSRTIVHIDMDAFYAAVEMRENPALKDRPMAVGGSAMLSTSNYEARRFGVRAAMPGFIARKLCPDLVIVPLNFEKYRQASQDVKEILLQYDSNMCSMSLDEAYVDITQHLSERENFSVEQRTYVTTEGEERTFGICAEETVSEMRLRVETKTHLTASAGIAPNMMLAKVCSDYNKPNGQYTVPFNRQGVMDFVRDLPVRKVCGIGRVSCSMLSAFGVVTCGDLYKKRGLLLKLYSPISFNYFLRVSAGVGSTSVQRGEERKSMSTERTFSEINRPVELFAKCYELCETLVEDLKAENLSGKTVTLKIKTIQYIVRTKTQSLFTPTRDLQQIYAAVRDLLRSEIRLCAPEPLRLRLMGVRLSNLSHVTTSETQVTMPEMLKKSSGEEETLPFGAVRREGFLSFLDQSAEDYSEATLNEVETPLEESAAPGTSRICDRDLSHDDTEPVPEQKEHVVLIDPQTLSTSDVNSKDTARHDDIIPSTSRLCLVNADFLCPVCEKHPQGCHDLQTLNEHIDLCLLRANGFTEGDRSQETHSTFRCPVCSLVLRSSLDSFNAHVDACLNRKTIKEILSDQSESVKRICETSSMSSKRLKSDGRHTLHKYFTSPK